MATTRTTTCSHCQRLVAQVMEDRDSAEATASGDRGPQACPFCSRPLRAAPQNSQGYAGRPVCRQCGAELTLMEATRTEQVCWNAACLQHQLSEQVTANRKARKKFREEMEARAAEFREEQADLPQKLPISLAVVPVNERAIVPLPEQRKQALRDHLQWVMQEEESLQEVPQAELPTPFKVPQPIDPAPSPLQDRLLGLCCAVCRGYCCRQGEEHGFQDVPSMRRIRQHFSAESAEELMARYEERFPQKSYEDSCVFHTDTGCNLPREMRSDMCNTWHCAGQREWLSELPAEGQLLGYVVASTNYQPHAKRAAIVGGSIGSRRQHWPAV